LLISTSTPLQTSHFLWQRHFRRPRYFINYYHSYVIVFLLLPIIEFGAKEREQARELPIAGEFTIRAE
jgi:hypothetical protein